MKLKRLTITEIPRDRHSFFLKAWQCSINGINVGMIMKQDYPKFGIIYHTHTLIKMQSWRSQTSQIDIGWQGSYPTSKKEAIKQLRAQLTHALKVLDRLKETQ